MYGLNAQFLNLILRCITLGSRFLLIFFLAKFLSPAEVGLYGLFAASVGYSLYFVGMDFYVFTTREILKTPDDRRGHILMSQIRLSGVLYLIFIPIFATILAYLDWPLVLVFGFVPIMILEHINQELYRLLVALSRQLTASVILFMRQGSWALIFVALLLFHENARHLGLAIVLWAASGCVALAIGLWTIYHMRFQGWRRPIDWQWVWSGIKVSLLFLVATLALRAINTVDRYVIEAFINIEAVGAYVLFFGIASTLMTFMDAGVFAFAYPKLIRQYQSHQPHAAQKEIRKLATIAILFSAVFAITSTALLPVLLAWIDKPIFTEYAFLYPWVLAGATLFMLSMIPHYALYAQNKDRPIIYSHITALGIFLSAIVILKPIHPQLAVPIAIILAFCQILVWKTLAYKNTVL